MDEKLRDKVALILVIIIFFQNNILKAQSFKNLDFEQKCNFSKTSRCHWDLSWASKVKILTAETTKKGSLLIEGEDETSIGFVEQSEIPDTSSGLRMITFTGKIKTKNVVGKGAGLSLSLLDKEGNIIFSQYMGNNILSATNGTNNWTEYKLQAICAPQVDNIKIGAILSGKGQAWFDDFEYNIQSVKDRQPNELSKKYISHVCRIIEKHSLMRDSIDLDTLKTIALSIAGQAKEYADCHIAVEYLISSLGDRHSFFMKPEKAEHWLSAGSESQYLQNIKYAKYELIDSFGYVTVPGFHSNDRELKIAFADSIQNALKQLQGGQLKGWIIDLRENDGGNMEPMLAGLGPLFDSEILGHLVDVDGKKEAWGYKNGAPFSGNELGESASSPIKLENPDLPKAVLIGPNTGSSGEIIVISFIDNKNTKSFGNPTWGISTGNGEFDLPDGAKLFLTSTVMADRKGQTYGKKIDPDFFVEESSGGDDAVLSAAIKWLKKQTD